MTPSNLILHCFHRRVGWVIRTFQIHGAKNCDDLFFGTKTGFGLLKRVTSPAFEEFFVFIEKNHPTRFSKKTLHKISIQKPKRFWMDVFFFSDPTSDIIHRQKTPRYLDLKSNCGWKSWVWVVTSASYRWPPDGWIGGWGWLGFKEDAEDFTRWISTRQKEWVGVCIGKWFSLKLFEGCDVNFWEFARKCRKQVKGFLSLLSCSCNFLHCKSISMTDLPVICS